MKVKLKSDGRYAGMKKAIGAVVAATPTERGKVVVLGADLADAGANGDYFFSTYGYTFFADEIEIQEEENEG